MIKDVVAFLESDTALQTLLNGGVNNKKIFPLLAPYGETSPYINYSTSADGSGDNVLEESVIQFSTIAETFELTRQISLRLSVLLDVWDNLSIPSTDFHIYYSRKVGGSDTKELDTELFNFTRLFHFKYKRKTGG